VFKRPPTSQSEETQLKDEHASSSYAEKLELVYQEFQTTLDLETSLMMVPLNDTDREQLRQDPELAAMMQVARARKFGDIITGITDIANTLGEKSVGTRLTALRELGRVLIPEKFKERSEVNLNLTYKVIPRKRPERAIA
jgi:hypothetical protein